METTSLSQEMLHCFAQLNEAEQKSVLEMIKTFLQGRSADFDPQTMEEYNRELEDADAEIEAGDYVTHEEVMKRYLKS
jgi:predicted transcriptional regulator